jgi:hypothetical protein
MAEQRNEPSVTSTQPQRSGTTTRGASYWLSRLRASRPDLAQRVSKRLGSRYVSGRTRDWLKFKNPEALAVKREAEEDWGR